MVLNEGKPKMDRSINDGLDYSGDAAAGSFFSSDYKRHDDLKQMLDSNRDNLKLEAMKRIIGMVAKGRDASELFPAVVKNVVSKNTEVKKLVYVYLVRYAEEQQDLALLSISTFQRALKDPNQLIRASALRVLSSIRVPMIAPIVMLSIRDSAADMSPYVRKTAAHAIPKLYSLDPDQKEELVTILDKLLSDRTTLVVGSAVMAFEEVCPERIDLIHKNYRKLCALLMDVDEWGQVVILNMLTRYARTQFVDPNIGDLSVEGEERPFYEDDENDKSGSDESDDDKKKEGKAPPKAEMDPDHRLLLKNAKPLLQSRNAAVVMAVAQLYYHCAPRFEVPVVVKALIRLLRSHSEVQAVVLTCIAAMSTERKTLFEPYLKSFYVRSSDPTQIKLLKLEILTNIANEANIPPILREFQTYISSHDKEFVAASIQAIGRCASNIKQVAETCLNGLVSLLSHRDPAVVGGAVVVAKTLLQSQKSGTKPVITQLAKMVERVTVPPARAAILWLLGEHCERLPHLPPDVLRKMAKTFPDEDDTVKLQIINLAAKLHLTNPKQTTLLCQYVLNLARYDQSYDIRDKARFIRHLLFPEKTDSKLTKYAKKILLSSKPAPVLQSKYRDRDHFQLGSMSHFLNTQAYGYQDLPGYPEEAPDPTVRIVEPPLSSLTAETQLFDLDLVAKSTKKKGGKKQKQKPTENSFYSESDGDEKSGSESSGSESGSESGTSDSESDSASESASKSSGSSEQSEDEAKPPVDTTSNGTEEKERKAVQYSRKNTPKDESSEQSSEGSDQSTSESESEEEIKIDKHKQKKEEKSSVKKSGNVDLLLDLEDMMGNENSAISPTPARPMSASFSPSLTSGSVNIETASPSLIPTKSYELLNKMVSGGMQVSYRFTRAPSLYSQSMISVELQFQNLGQDAFKDICISQHMLPTGMKVQDFQPISQLAPNQSTMATLAADFNDTTQGAKLELSWGVGEVDRKKHVVTINAPVGELIRPVTLSEPMFIGEQVKLRGMNEHEVKIGLNKDLSTSRQLLIQRVFETANLLQVPVSEDDIIRFAGQSVSSKTLVLFTIHFLPENSEGLVQAKLVANCEKIVIGSMLLQEIKESVK